MRFGREEESYCHQDCPYAAENSCDVVAYRQWRSRLKLAPRDQCFRCDLSQSLYTGVASRTPCLYPHLLLPGLFILQQVNYLYEICQKVGFSGPEEWQWQWLNQAGKGLFGRRELNWVRVWRRVGELYCEVKNANDSSDSDTLS